MSARNEILQKLLSDITNGIYSERGKLPSESVLTSVFGVSRMTVRAALDELVRQGLIEKRNGAGSFLTARAARRSGLIGLVIPDYAAYGFFTAIKSEAERHAERLGYHIELVYTRAIKHDEAVLDIRAQVERLASERTEGVIFRPFVSEDQTEANQEIVDKFRHANIPVVLIDSDITLPPKRSDCDLVTVDNISAGRRIASHLNEHGYRRIGFLMQGKSSFVNANWRNRLFGLAGELALLGNYEGVRQLFFSPHDAAALSKLLRGRPKLEAIVCGNDEQAAALLKTLAELGKRAPDDLAVIGFDDIPLSRVTDPPLTTISQPVRKIAATAFKTLLARIRYPNNDPREIHLSAPLVARKTTCRSF